MGPVTQRLQVLLGRALLLFAVVAVACAAPPPPPLAPPRPSVKVAGPRQPPADHTKDRKGIRHKSGSKQALANCGPCHGRDLKGAQGPSCYACHGQEWH